MRTSRARTERARLAWVFLVVASALAWLPAQADALKILVGNDDGFGTANIRALYAALRKAGHDVIIAAPSSNQSGTDGRMADPKPLDKDGEFGLVKKGAPAEGADPKDDHIWYVNSTPASSIQFGLDTLCPRLFGSPPDLVLTGPNQGNNLGLAYLVSGTYGAAKYAVSRGIPAVAFSAEDSANRPYTQLAGEGEEDQANVYANMAVKLVQQLGASPGPLLPANVGLNVNFPSAPKRSCKSASSHFVASRLLGNAQRSPDACTCGATPPSGCKLPVESGVIGDDKNGCTNTVSAFEPTVWSPDASAEKQAAVFAKLGDLLSCLTPGFSPSYSA